MSGELAKLMGRLLRKGVTLSVVDGLVRIEGWNLLSAAEREQLREDRDNARARLEAREHRRQRRAARRRMKQQPQPNAQQQQARKVIGMVAAPGYPHLARPLFADEVKEIDVSRARVLGTVPYGWRKS